LDKIVMLHKESLFAGPPIWPPVGVSNKHKHCTATKLKNISAIIGRPDSPHSNREISRI